ncbi:MAG: hypothetical protein Q7R32_13195 [Dehalococcoidia bacterium]|nr:hypothetical protein [Dehalococcoidia bacterium]
MRRLTVTIDTNSINARQMNPHLNRLEKWHQAGLIEITRTSVLDEELATDFTKMGESRRQRAQRYTMGKDTLVFTQKESFQKSGDFLKGPIADEWLDPTTQILHPGKHYHELSIRDKRDISHLATHKLHRWDYFVTTDRRDILSRAEDLWWELSIKALSPEDAVREIGAVLQERASE